MDDKQSEGLHGQSMDDALLCMLTDTIQGMVRGQDEEREWRRRALGAMRQLSVFHASGVTAWRDALRGCFLIKEPLGGVPLQPHPDCSSIFRSVMDDLEHIQDQLNMIFNRLDTEIIHLSAERADSQDQIQTKTEKTPAEAQSGCEEEAKDGGDDNHASFICDDDAEGGLDFKDQGWDAEETLDIVSANTQKEETSKEWTAVGFENSEIAGACFIRAPLGAAGVLRCEVADALSCLMVSGAEELVSRVIRVRVQDYADIRFPLTMALPFCARHRGIYRSIAVKVVNGERKASYIVPATTEGTYGGQRGSFAEVKVYSLGLFAVVSCLKQEHFTVPRRGVSHKLPVDPRICLDYPPGSFTAPVMVQYTIQPLDAVLLAAVKLKSEAYRRVVSTSPLLCLAHPSSQPLRRPLTVTLPCPPNPDKRKDTRAQWRDVECLLPLPVAAPPVWDRTSFQWRRMLGSSTQSSKENPAELLSVMGSTNRHWSVPEGIAIRSHQNGLVSFDLMENFDRLLVVRLLSPLQPCHLTCLAEDLVDSAHRHQVTVVLQPRQDQPRAILVVALPSRELSWELSRLQAGGNEAPLEMSPEICMREGDQLVLRLCGNVTCAGLGTNEHGVLDERITFHSQRRNELLVHLTEVDPFGNYSSPHYKGAAVFYKVTRGQAEWRGDKAVQVDVEHLGEPVCKLPLTLPKRIRSIRQPVTPKITLCERTDCLPDSLLLWLSGELSEEEIGHLALSLHLRRSATQMVKLRAGDNLPGQAFRILTMWRRELPASQLQPKASQLARCLARSGRPDLARELLLRQAATTVTPK
ncbi:death domain-containing protein 1 [Dunckerocampus dactyliophorus]|uniref:death domain-containing protein 1 n=1 Tax=Dunckerocampus dactyliophorus TaxID=161453 RepID=UPI002404B472|nr:death domain-containing protein 1 [Dunckerocampus dactyliophorus]